MQWLSRKKGVKWPTLSTKSNPNYMYLIINSRGFGVFRLKHTLYLLWFRGCIFLTALLFMAQTGLYAQSNDTVTNKTVISLHKAGLGKEIITAKINTSACNFDLSTDGLINLKKNGVPDDIVAFMISKGNSPPPVQQNNIPQQNNTPQQNTAPDQSSQAGGELSLQPGLYYFDANSNNYVEIDAAIFSNSKSGGLGETLLRTEVSGLFNAKLKESLSGIDANLKINNAKPLFVFVIDIINGKDGPNVKTPNEIILVKLKPGKNDRELVVGKTNSVGSEMGIDDKVKLAFTYNKVQKGLYEVSSNDPLPTGEYCFMYAASSSGGQGAVYTAYDFSIRVPGEPVTQTRGHHSH